MPHSLVLNLTPQSPIYPQFLTGRHYHALFLSLVSSVDIELGNYLHQSNANKAFTLSPLQVYKNHDKPNNYLQWEYPEPIMTGTSCWWRISLLDDTLFGKLTKLWLNLNPKHPWHLGSADLYITGIQGTPQLSQPWANACTYTQLYDRASDSDRTLSFHLATPISFRQGKFDNPLPSKESVFKSLLNNWNKYSEIELDSMVLESIYPSFFNIKTEIVRNYQGSFIGCLGTIKYQILGEMESNTIKQINALADFALYCGLGRKTTMGMGMVRRNK
ncbi:CRISPR-associated endoribonuclease Cas6 [Merismopedia glauca]|uniref:CRISPR-associated endoribonuclease Cas6 n=1 Tax=Merismopedia glauca CCAP 1448/3 TaxID=1296344 RepID=A0A2T1BZ11_9CYAN|nr:CRISPR-associated endoribonuclease Cas6 [Merismopedia glauca]PSB01138.1 CRISPR-associated endoribonuclease Cas6 [Merismopedia glauca CCAP 1448/3]